MERLTNVGTNGEIWISDNDETRKIGQKEAVYKKLKTYEDADEQGLLLRLPCKIGNTVYETYRDGEYCTSWWDIRQRKFTLTFYEKHINDFNKTVFLTQEEAEARLKKMEENNENTV